MVVHDNNPFCIYISRIESGKSNYEAQAVKGINEETCLR